MVNTDKCIPTQSLKFIIDDCKIKIKKIVECLLGNVLIDIEQKLKSALTWLLMMSVICCF